VVGKCANKSCSALDTEHEGKLFRLDICNHFQIAMPAYNLNCWLLLFHREERATAEQFKHMTLATARLRFLFLAAKIWRHAGRVGVSYSDQYPERGLFQRLMERLRSIAPGERGFQPVLATALRL
jgi:hypothetical protein